MTEIVRGFVPRIAISPRHGFGTGSYAMLITDTRLVLVPQREAAALLGPLLDVGVIEASGIAKSESALNPEAWERYPGAFVIPHGAVERLRCQRAMNTYLFSLEFRSEERSRKLSGFLLPSRTYLRRKKQEGVRPSKSAWDYAEATGAVLKQVAFSASVLDWHV